MLVFFCVEMVNGGEMSQLKRWTYSDPNPLLRRRFDRHRPTTRALLRPRQHGGKPPGPEKDDVFQYWVLHEHPVLPTWGAGCGGGDRWVSA
jgi:hypothetical protein